MDIRDKHMLVDWMKQLQLAMASARARYTQELRETCKKGDRTREELYKLIPENMEAYIRHHGVFHHLLEHGSCAIPAFNPPALEKDMFTLREELQRLKGAWKGMIAVEWSPPRFETPPTVMFVLAPTEEK